MMLHYLAVPTFSLLLGICSQSTYGAKILFYPLDAGFNSRVINLAKLATYLQDDGHDVSMIINKPLLDIYNPEHLNIIKYDIPKSIILPSVQEMLVKFQTAAVDPSKITDLVRAWAQLTSGYCDAFLSHTELLADIKVEQYDLLFTDYGNECSRIVSDYLDITTILYSNHGFTMSSFIYPRMPSFMCDAFAPFCSSDEMEFMERVINFIFMIFYDNFLYPNLLTHFQDIREKYNLNTSISISNPVRFSRSIVIVNADFVLDYPRPVMPHVFPISGLYTREPNPLPTDLANIIEQSVYDSVVVASFGTLVHEVSSERAEIMAQVFGKLSATVIWRFTAAPPKALAENTKLVGWFPQYDVLAHPKTKLFVTHCGVSATFEAASLGIPVVAIPMLADQRYHAIQLVNRLKMGVLTSWAEFNEAEFEENVVNVLNNPEFMINAKRAAELMNDRDIEPRKKFLHLVNFTIRHNGAEHLISRPGRELSTLQFYSVDVICFLLLLTALFVLLILLSFRASFRFFHKLGFRKLKIH